MFPFVFVDASKLGPFHTYGVCVALGYFAWDYVALRRAKTLGYDLGLFRALFVWCIAVGLPMSWIVEILFYDSSAMHIEGAWSGFSSTGGILGACVGALAWRAVDVTRSGWKIAVKRRDPPLPVLPFADIIVSTFCIPFAFGRLGCSLIHDHPGIVAPGSPFTVAWPIDAHDGTPHVFGPFHVVWGSVPRYDMGLLELFVLIAICIGFAISFRRTWPIGVHTAAGCIAYAPARFALDFLRPDELRHAGLTFAQWWSVAVFAIGVYVAAQVVSRSRRLPSKLEIESLASRSEPSTKAEAKAV